MAIVNNKALAEKIERIKKNGTRAYIEKQLEINPYTDSARLSLKRKGDFFCIGSVSFGVGFGMEEAVTHIDLETIEEFIRNNGNAMHAQFEITPFCDPLLLAMLQESNYTLDHFLTVWVMELDDWQHKETFAVNRGIKIEEVAGEAIYEWAWTVALGISKDHTVSEEMMEATRIFLEVPENTGFLLKENGESAAAGTLAINGTLAEMFLASTIHAYRGRGYQNRLIQERIAFAKAKGCTHITVTTEPNTVSSRNMEKNGFRLIYHKAVLKSQKIY